MKKNNIYKAALYIIGVTLLTLLDQYTKILAVTKLKNSRPLVIIDGVFEFTYLQNDGAAWGMLSGQQTLFVVLTVVVVLILLYTLLRIPFNRRFMPMHIVILMLTSGALGNFIDRVLYGYVRDFIYFKLIDFPVFNVADIYVTVSMIIFAIMFLFVYKEGEFSFLKPLNMKRSSNHSQQRLFRK